ncbi:MAG TPA: sigma-70 family RNA polymerase sigma factor [Kofleriaceae bacterium]|nr:sigma-70 family RNA polymerase sigma factor [Kofleriaceae bacterium]
MARLASDQRLVEQARTGSEVAFETLYRRYREQVLVYCRRVLGSTDDAEDATQQTFLAAYSALGHLEQPVALRAWLYGIARHRCQSVLRLRREGPRERAPEQVADRLAADVVARDDLRAVLADVAKLPDDQRFAIVQAEVFGVPYEQIADALGCRHEKVKALVFQARASLTANRTAREMPCAEIRHQLLTLHGAALRRGALRRHMLTCAECRAFREQLRGKRRGPRALVPAFLVQRGVLGPLFGGTGETALTAGAVGTGLAAAALAALAIHAGDTPVTTPTHHRAARAPRPFQGVVVASPAAAPMPIVRTPVAHGRRSADRAAPVRKRARTHTEATPGPPHPPSADPPSPGVDKPTAAAADTPVNPVAVTPANPAPASKPHAQYNAAKPSAPPGQSRAHSPGPPAKAHAQKAHAIPNPGPKADPLNKPAREAGPQVTHGAANGPNHDPVPGPQANGPPAGHDPGPATPPSASHSGGSGG